MVGNLLFRQEERIDVLSALQDGWHDGDGEGPTIEAISKARLALSLIPEVLEHATIFPTWEGGILFEISRGGDDISLEIDKLGGSEIYGLLVDGGDTPANADPEWLVSRWRQAA